MTTTCTLVLGACPRIVLHQCLARLMDDPALRRSLAEEATRGMQAGDYTWQGNARRVVDPVNAEGAINHARRAHRS